MSRGPGGAFALACLPLDMFRCPSCGAFNRVREPRPPGQPTCGRCQRGLDLSGAPQEVAGAALWQAVRASPVPILLDLWAPRDLRGRVVGLARETSGVTLCTG